MVCILILGCRLLSTMRGEIMHMAQSPVGNVLSSRAIVPPMDGSSLTMWTSRPLLARSRAACIPPIPEPTTSTEPVLSCPGVLLVKTTSFGSVPFRLHCRLLIGYRRQAWVPIRLIRVVKSMVHILQRVPLSWKLSAMTISFFPGLLSKPSLSRKKHILSAS